MTSVYDRLMHDLSRHYTVALCQQHGDYYMHNLMFYKSVALCTQQQHKAVTGVYPPVTLQCDLTCWNNRTLPNSDGPPVLKDNYIFGSSSISTQWPCHQRPPALRDMFHCTTNYIYIQWKPVLRDHCHQRPPVLRDHKVLAENLTFQWNWTCHGLPKDHLSWKTIFLWPIGWSFKTEVSTVQNVSPKAKARASSPASTSIAPSGPWRPPLASSSRLLPLCWRFAAATASCALDTSSSFTFSWIRSWIQNTTSYVTFTSHKSKVQSWKWILLI